jgi:hypothetical protein
MESQQPEQSVTPQQKDKRDDTQELDQSKLVSNDTDMPATTWRFRDTEDPTALSKPKDDKRHNSSDSISWTASEFVEHNKGFGWYLCLILAILVLSALIYALTHDKISTGAVVLAGIVLGVFAARKPRILQYRLDNGGLTIGNKSYGYDVFKSFSVIDEDALSSIYLLPLKRFMPSLSLYYAQKDEKKIIDILSERLPFEERHSDTVDRFMHRIRF